MPNNDERPGVLPDPRTNLKSIEQAIRVIRDERVILDADLAALYGIETKRLNEQVKRNKTRFEHFAFQLTPAEFAALKSQSATSKPGRGGRRTPPWAFTEHGVVMAATVLDSHQAVEASRFVVEVFVELRRRAQAGEPVLLDQNMAAGEAATSLERLSALGSGFTERLQAALEHVLDSVIDVQRQTTVREEAQTLISESVRHIKNRLQKQGIENDELAAKATKLLAEAEKDKAVAAKTRAEAEQIEFAIIVRKLRLLLEAQRAIERHSMDEFFLVLKELGE